MIPGWGQGMATHSSILACLFESNPVGEGTTRRGTATPVHRPQRPAGSTHSSTRGLRPPEHTAMRPLSRRGKPMRMDSQAGALPLRISTPWRESGSLCSYVGQCMKVKSESEVTQLCPSLWDPIRLLCLWNSPPRARCRSWGKCQSWWVGSWKPRGGPQRLSCHNGDLWATGNRQKPQ